MKRIHPFLLCASLLACDHDDHAADELDPELGDATHQDAVEDAPDLADAIEVAQEQLAHVALDDGEVTFWVDVDGPAAGSIAVLETSEPDEHGAVWLRDTDDLTALELFLEITPDTTPVPQALIDSEPSTGVIERAKWRPQVDGLTETIVGSATQLRWSAAFMCGEGLNSAQFLHEICSANDWTLDFCHNGTWHSVTDDTGSLGVEWSRSRTLACGANGRARHYYRFWGVWYKPIDRWVPSTTMYRFTHQAATGLKLRRAITHSRTASGFVRGASHFMAFPF